MYSRAIRSCHRLSELQLDEANSSDTEAPFLDLRLTISDGFVSSKVTEFIYLSLFGLLECLVMSLTLTVESIFNSKTSQTRLSVSQIP